jgi:hypothetical protein
MSKSLQYVMTQERLGDSTVWECAGEDGCGALVLDRSRHSAWHADVWGGLTEVVPGYGKRERREENTTGRYGLV